MLGMPMFKEPCTYLPHSLHRQHPIHFVQLIDNMPLHHLEITCKELRKTTLLAIDNDYKRRLLLETKK